MVHCEILVPPRPTSSRDEVVEFLVTGLMLDFSPGKYWLGTTNILEPEGQTATVNTLREFNAIQADGEFFYFTGRGDRVFSVFGDVATVPTQGTLGSLLLCLSLLGLRSRGFAGLVRNA